ncbi:hypothetical protein WICMUC_000538 [Wickerhamomyces mucosus]|uniref:GYF domain-containing protein n=1 Tax=Wickerhamomyces mucosus TaxID=1378264 RepID=A0A9P8PXS3_9ASCO|nr:hypothetical protein WICMUC_000538 [Wickerhamomyces mucosus]
MTKTLKLDISNPLGLRLVGSEEDSKKSIEDELLEQDIDGNQRKRRQSKRIDTTQYENDSSDEEYKPKNKEKETQNDEDGSESDMFSDDEPTEPEEKTNKNTNTIKLLNEEELREELGVEGEDYEKISDVEDSESDEVKKPKLDAFNIKEELKEGRFDEAGNYIRITKDSDDEEKELKDEEWYEGLKKKDFRKAKKAQEDREKQRIEKQNLRSIEKLENLLIDLISILEPVESSIEALQRFSAKPKKKKAKWTNEERSKEDERSKTVMKITELCENIIGKGISDVYDLEKEELMLIYKQETGEQYKKPVEVKADNDVEISHLNDNILWEFRWLEDNQIHGPYSNSEMTYWKDNYFGNRVEVRKVGTQSFIHIEQLTHFE